MKKILTIALLAVFTIGSLGFSVAATQALGPVNRGWGWNIGFLMKQNATVPFQRSWVRLNGIAETWGSVEVNGSLSINARAVVLNETVRGSAFATIIWSDTVNSVKSGNARTNFSYSFYAARLSEANISKLDFEGSDFFLNGNWNVVRVVITQNVIKSGNTENGYTLSRQTKTDVEPISTGSYGELRITDNWTEFLLSIEGTEELRGVIARTRMTHMSFNKFKVSEDDTDRVSIVDLRVIAKNYGARPGWGSYDSNMDFNCNYKIDIADIATVATNIQSP